MTELAPGAHALGSKRGGHVRAFLLEGRDGFVLVDTLFETDGGLVLEELRRQGRRTGDLKHIVITHGHRSHLGGAAALKRASGATVWAHEWEADIVSGDRRAQPVTLRPTQTLRLWPFQAGLALGKPKHAPCPVDRHLEDGDEVGPLRVLHAPGHSPGHLAFHWPERRLLLAGDSISTWPDFREGWKAFNLNPGQNRDSLRRMAELDVEILGVGHGDPIPGGGRERLQELVERPD